MQLLLINQNYVPVMSFSSFIFLAYFNLSQTRKQKEKNNITIFIFINEDGNFWQEYMKF